MRYALLLYDSPAHSLTVLEDETTVTLPKGTVCVRAGGFLSVRSDKPLVALDLFDPFPGTTAHAAKRSVELKPEEANG